jgi:hypothetical protein
MEYFLIFLGVLEFGILEILGIVGIVENRQIAD